MNELGSGAASAIQPKDYVTKDSGARQMFASGMQRDTQDDKMLWHLVASGPMLERWAGLMTRGADKYDEDNWKDECGCFAPPPKTKRKTPPTKRERKGR